MPGRWQTAARLATIRAMNGHCAFQTRARWRAGRRLILIGLVLLAWPRLASPILAAQPGDGSPGVVIVAAPDLAATQGQTLAALVDGLRAALPPGTPVTLQTEGEAPATMAALAIHAAACDAGLCLTYIVTPPPAATLFAPDLEAEIIAAWPLSVPLAGANDPALPAAIDAAVGLFGYALDECSALPALERAAAALERIAGIQHGAVLVFYRGLCLHNQHDYPAALAVLAGQERAMMIRAGAPWPLRLLWDAYAADSHAQSFAFDRALAWDTRIIALATSLPADEHPLVARLLPELYLQRGRHRLYLYEWDAVLADYNAALALPGFPARAYYDRGLLYYTQNVRQAAYDDLTRYLTLESDPASRLIPLARRYVAELQALLANSSRAVRRPSMRVPKATLSRIAAVLLTAALLGPWLGMGTAAPVQAQGANTLVIVNLPGALGETLAAQVETRLTEALPGSTVRLRHAPLDSVDAARRTGRLDGATLVVWAAPDAPDAIVITTVNTPRFAPVPLSVTLPLVWADQRQVRPLAALIAGQTAVLRHDPVSGFPALNFVLRAAPEDWPGRAEAFYYRGQGIASVAESLPNFEAAMAIVPRWHYAHALAWDHFYLDERDQAIAAMGQAITLAPELPALYLDRAYFYEQQHTYPAALADYGRVLVLQPDDTATLRRRGGAFLANGDPEAALADYDRLISLRPNDPAALLARTDAHFALGDYPGVLADIDAALALHPADPDRYIFARGLAHLYLGENDTAIADLQDYTDRQPGDVAGWINLGQAQEASGDLTGATLSFEAALTIDSEATYLYSTLARLYYQTGATLQPPERGPYLALTIEAATQALRVQATDTGALLYRALAYMDQGRNDLALYDLDAALSSDPSFATATLNRAIVHTRLGDAARRSRRPAGPVPRRLGGLHHAAAG